MAVRRRGHLAVAMSSRRARWKPASSVVVVGVFFLGGDGDGGGEKKKKKKKKGESQVCMYTC